MIVHDAKTGETKAIDYREMAPAFAERDMYLDAEGNADSELSRFTGLAVGGRAPFYTGMMRLRS